MRLGEGVLGWRETMRFLSVQFQGGIAFANEARNICNRSVELDLESRGVGDSKFGRIARLSRVLSHFFTSHMFKIYYHGSIGTPIF